MRIQNKSTCLELSETHTNNTVTDTELSVRGFTLERKDRSASRGGGVSLYIREQRNNYGDLNCNYCVQNLRLKTQ